MIRPIASRALQISVLAALLCCGVLPSLAQCLDSCYYTRQELYDRIFELDAQDTRGIMRIDSIGHSRGDALGEVYPIYAVKVSDNVDVFEDEPTLMIIAHIHGEEVLGIQVTMTLLADMVNPARYGLWRNLVQNTQIYFIPTMNPDGLEVISRGLDCYWRKNGYVPPELLGRDCNIVQGAGSDSCGVDLNRNFDLNWIYGDTLWAMASEPFDYYRGPSPFSEPEAQAIAEFAFRIKPTVSIVYHMSRQGGVAEQVIVPWQWPGIGGGFNKFPPDCTSIGQLNRSYSTYLIKNAGGAYTTVWGGTRNGVLHEWFYWKLGTIQIETELGPAINIQPPCSTSSGDDVFGLVRDDLESLRWMLYRPSRVDEAADGPTPLNIYTRDAQTLDSISAEYRVLNTWSALLAPWYTNEEHGRATLLPVPGSITVMARKEGYVNDTVTVTVNPNSSPRTITLDLDPLPWYNLTLRLKDTSGNNLAGWIYLDYDFPKWVSVAEGGTTYALPQGSYRIMAAPSPEGHMVLWRNLWLGADATEEFALPPADVIWSEDFSQGIGNWTVGGEHGTWNVEMDTTAMGFGQCLSTNPPGYLAQYENNANTWIQLTNALNVPGGNVCYLEFYRRGRLDIPSDSVFVEVSTDGSNWQKAAGFCDMQLPWTRTYVDLSQWTPNYFYLRFRLQSDSALGDLGLRIDQIRIFSGTDLAVEPENPGVVYKYRITGAYPNPFNPSTTISYEVAKPGPLTLAVFNVLGEEVRRFDLNAAFPGAYRLAWDGTTQSGTSLSSGVYFIRMDAPGTLQTRKLLLLR